MKSLLILGLAAVLCGCSGMPDRTERCNSYQVAYTLYTSTSRVREVSQDEAAAAAFAALFLTSYCGWTATRASDTNGVPILVPPTP